MEVEFGCEEENTNIRGVCGLKVGRSWDATAPGPYRRALPFAMKVLAYFPGIAHIEHDVHELLAEIPEQRGRGPRVVPRHHVPGG